MLLEEFKKCVPTPIKIYLEEQKPGGGVSE